MLCEAAVDRALGHEVTAEWDPRAALGVVLAAGGYPDAVNKGDVIEGLEAVRRSFPARCFMPGRALNAGTVVTNGGRVLCAVGLGSDRRRSAARRLMRWSTRFIWNGCPISVGISAISAVAREQSP